MAEKVKVVESRGRREEVSLSEHGGVEHREHIGELLALFNYLLINPTRAVSLCRSEVDSRLQSRL